MGLTLLNARSSSCYNARDFRVSLEYFWNILVGAVASGLVMLRTHVLFEIAELGKLTVAVFHFTLKLLILDLLLISTLNLANVWVDCTLE